jgi:hypothetical protein
MFRINLDPPVQQPINVLANNIFVSNQARNLTKLKLQERSSQPTWQWFSFCRHYVMHGHHSSIIQFTPTTKVHQLELLMDGINHVHIFSLHSGSIVPRRQQRRRGDRRQPWGFHMANDNFTRLSEEKIQEPFQRHCHILLPA